MRFRSTTLVFLVLAGSLFAADARKTLFIDKMGGLETFVEKALAEKEVKVEVIEEAMHPDLKVQLGKTFTSVYAEILYQKQTGRKEESTLKAIDVKTGKALVEHSFHLSDDASKKRAAETFVEALKKKMN